VLYDGSVMDAPVTETIGDYKFTATFVVPFASTEHQNTATHGGLIIQTSG